MKIKKGISLIVLVITIIVIIILAGAVILSLASNNPISSASEATFKSNVDSYNSELTMALSNEYLQDSRFNSNKFNKKVWLGGDIEGTIKQYIPSITAEDAAKFEIQKGQLVYVVTDGPEENWITDLGILEGEPLPPYIEVGLDVIATDYATFDGAAATYDNPVIPKGFKAINTTTTWPNDWDNGLVIEDANGNQFVWVPVDGTNVIYQKWGVDGVPYVPYNDPSLGDGSLPSDVVEAVQIEKYQGFYIGRYEAMFDYNVGNIRVASKKSIDKSTPNWTRDEAHNGYLWNWIHCIDAKLYAENMATDYGYDTSKLLTTLVTGAEWDTTLTWIQNSGKSVTDSRAWGNYGNSISPADVSGCHNLQISGFSEEWKAKNIYDLAGNELEWTNESFGTGQYIARGGHFYSTSFPAIGRDWGSIGNSADHIGFRVALYVI
jgi:hypothetical protein